VAENLGECSGLLAAHCLTCRQCLAYYWQGFSRAELASIAAPVLIIIGDRDFVRARNHEGDSQCGTRGRSGFRSFRLYSEREKVIPIVQHFLEKSDTRIPVATAGMGFDPGETR